MILRANSCYSQLDTICRQAEEQFSNLMANVKNAATLRGDLHDLQDFLECVPLATDEYELTVARINNARRYLESNEQGAAKYEIRQLIRSLRGRMVSDGYTQAVVGWIGEDVDEPSQNVIPAA